MTARTLLIPAALFAAAVSPAFAQDPAPSAAPAPQAVERVNRRAAADAPARGHDRVDAPAAGVRERLQIAAPTESTPAAAFEEQGGRRRPSGGGGGNAGGGGRVSGGSGSRGGSGSSGGDAVRRGGGVRNPDNDGSTSSGQAVSRGQAPRGSWGSPGWSPRYGRRYYGGAGFGYYLYDPWSWYGWGWPAYSAYAGWGWGGYYGNYYGGYGGYYGGYGRGYGWGGGVRLKVDHRDAEVFVDGYYAGTVDDFDGMFQELRLDDGGYRIEIRKPGFETLVFDVRIQPGRTITYRGHMVPEP